MVSRFPATREFSTKHLPAKEKRSYSVLLPTPYSSLRFDLRKLIGPVSVSQIMDSRAIVCTVPDERKAAAVHDTVKGDISPEVPASILQRHPDAAMFIDHAAASRLRCQWSDSDWTSHLISYCEMCVGCNSRAYDAPSGNQPDRYVRCQ